LLRQLTADWDYVAAGGLTLGADPVAGAMMHAAAAAGEVLDVFVVRKEAKAHGMQRRIEGIEVAGQPVLAVEDTSTTGGSVRTSSVSPPASTGPPVPARRSRPAGCPTATCWTSPTSDCESDREQGVRGIASPA
jgi:hypothetical protein